MSLAKKLNLDPSKTLRVSGKPANVALGDVKVAAKAGAELLFVKKLAEVDAKAAAIVAAARADRIAWIAYPKAGQLGTDLNRDVLWRHLLKSGIQGIRQIRIDDVWSAMRFRPKPGSAKSAATKPAKKTAAKRSASELVGAVKPAAARSKGINVRWHGAHRLGTGASLDARIAWHVAHEKACACRPMPASIRTALAGRSK